MITSLFVTGSAGRVGRALRAAWGMSAQPVDNVLWSGRYAAQGIDIEWDIANTPAPPLPRGAIWLHLAGQTGGDATALAENRRTADAACLAAHDHQARHLFFMSSVAVYRPGPGLLSEASLPSPLSPYGAAKLAAEHAAQQVLAQSPTGLTVLRLANLAGADALLGPRVSTDILTLDPVPGPARGPERSYIGPVTLASVLRDLIGLLIAGHAVPSVLNLAQPPAVAMADMLDARGLRWRFGPPNPRVIPRVAVDTALLSSLVPLAPVTATSLVADLDQLAGAWP